MTTSDSDDKQKSELSSGLSNPAGRGGADSEMAATILYLAGPGGLFCNGEVIHPDVSRYPLCLGRELIIVQGGNLLIAPAVM